MKRKSVFSLIIAVGICVLGLFAQAGWWVRSADASKVAPNKVTQGALQISGSRSECPLKHTDVKAEISGGLARATVTQEFQNPLNEKIEAVYVFPLSANAAVDDLTMVVGERVIKGKIKRREEARQIYEAARDAGQTAGLLDQERPNIFTQSVANIAPGATVKITISYIETLKYEDGAYEFVFPMVVGPRYVPGRATGKTGGGSAFDTNRVPDASRITPQAAAKGMRAGHDISIEVKLDAGVPIDSIQSKLHAVETERTNAHAAVVRLKDQNTIPNKDFVLKFDVAGKTLADALMTHRAQAGGFFTMMLQPPERVVATEVAPKEIVFVLDTSGSMEGFPIEKAKEAMRLAIDGLNPLDTFNLITFAGDTHVLFPQPRPATRENLQLAQVFLASRRGGGGTEMMKAIRTALAPSDSQEHIRIVCFMTDGYVGDDMEIIAEVQKHPNARVFSFGIGESVNRFLLDKLAEEGRGEVEYVSLNDDGSAAARRFHQRVRNPLLTDIRVEWNGLPVADVYPKRLPDLFSAKPLVLTGRYRSGAQGTIRLTGRVGGQSFARDIAVVFPESEAQHDVLATLWARTRIDDLMRQDFSGIQNGNPKDEVKEAITQLGLEYRLMTQFTSFVAVEETTVIEGGQPVRVDVPVELPEGLHHTASIKSNLNDVQQILGLHEVDISSLFINSRQALKAGEKRLQEMVDGVPPPPLPSPPPVKPAPTPVSGKRIVVSEGVLNGATIKKVQPAYPPLAKAAKAAGAVQVQITI
ncbi:MAG TPA: VIT and VWA domain-containing protein, partial [Blastocatellia bacterium]|nr:VIT and VWA domain-containing protein [Blastocatellia bacterium]